MSRCLLFHGKPNSLSEQMIFYHTRSLLDPLAESVTHQAKHSSQHLRLTRQQLIVSWPRKCSWTKWKTQPKYTFVFQRLRLNHYLWNQQAPPFYLFSKTESSNIFLMYFCKPMWLVWRFHCTQLNSLNNERSCTSNLSFLKAFLNWLRWQSPHHSCKVSTFLQVELLTTGFNFPS